MKTPIEAFEFTLTKVWELKESGIGVTIEPQKKLDTDWDKEIGLPPEKWVCVTFKIKNKEQAEKILEVANYLLLAGITFDSGGCKECRDWELDWSFRFKKGEENFELAVIRGKVEDEINNL